MIGFFLLLSLLVIGMLGFGTIVVVAAAAGNIVFQATVSFSAAKAGVSAVISDVG